MWPSSAALAAFSRSVVRSGQASIAPARYQDKLLQQDFVKMSEVQPEDGANTPRIRARLAPPPGLSAQCHRGSHHEGELDVARDRLRATRAEVDSLESVRMRQIRGEPVPGARARIRPRRRGRGASRRRWRGSGASLAAGAGAGSAVGWRRRRVGAARGARGRGGAWFASRWDLWENRGPYRGLYWS
jgi:hypothetical protein